MYPSSGYFKAVVCPFFVSGLCERPYCHFRHVKPDPKPVHNQSQRAPDGSRRNSTHFDEDLYTHGRAKAKPSLLSMVGNAIQQVKRDIAQDQHRLNSRSTTKRHFTNLGRSQSVPEYIPGSAGKIKNEEYTPQGPTDKGTSNKTAWYKPTPVDQQKPVYIPTKKTTSPTNGDSSAKYKFDPSPKYSVPPVSKYSLKQPLPEYNPTPINKLKDPSADTDLEYDPTSNFAYTTGNKRSLENSNSGSNCKRMKKDNLFDSFMDVEAKFSSDEEVAVVEKHECEGNKPDEVEDTDTEKSDAEKDGAKHNSENTEDVKHSESQVSSTVSNESDINIKCDSTENMDISKLDSNFENAEKTLDTTETNQNIEENVKEGGVESVHSSEEETKNLSGDGSKVKEKETKERHSSSDKAKSHKQSPSSKHKSSHSSHKSDKNSSKDRKHSGSAKSEHSSTSKSNSSKSEHSSSSKSKSSKSEHFSSSKSSSSKSKHSSSSKSGSSSKSSSHKSSSSSSSRHKHSDSKSSSKSSSSSSHKHGSRHKNGHSHSHKSNSSKKSSHSSSKDYKSKSNTSNKAKDIALRTSSTESNKSINLELFGDDSDNDDVVMVGGNSDNEVIDISSDEELASVPLDINLDEHDTYSECLRIFNEEQTANGWTKGHLEKKAAILEKKSSTNESSEPVVVGKKRTAHDGAHDASRVKKPVKPQCRPSPAQIMHNRFVQLQKQAETSVTDAQPSTSSAVPSISAAKKRTAHSGSLGSSLLAESKRLKRAQPPATVSTVPKGAKRVAHTPNKTAALKRPTIPTEFGSKVPTNIRQRYLNLIIDECLKIDQTEGEAYERALQEERGIYNRSSSRVVYLNVAVNAIKRLRSVSADGSQNKQSPQKTVTHQAVLGGSWASKTTFTLHRSGGPAQFGVGDFMGVSLYKKLSKYILTEKQLIENGFPRPDPDHPGKPLIMIRDDDRNRKNNSKLEKERICCRCGKRFQVAPNGAYVSREECVYHWGKAWKKRIAGAIDTRYTCCQGDLGAKGCQVASLHVHEQNKFQEQHGFMRTIPCSPPVDGDYGVYALDCEMVYTTGGVELARVTVIDPSLKPVYEALVKPEKTVIDYNTRFSGLTSEDLKGVHTTIRDVQAILLSLFSDKTILVGHSLESDLVALKLIHNTVVDTSVVFPHRLGPPFKRALKTLMIEYMKKIIQDDVGGHDSAEDAQSCLELMLWKVKEDAKMEHRRV